MQKYDVALLKEVVHHFKPAELTEIFGGILAQLTPGGRLAIATRPHRPVYPFFKAAAEVWRSQQPDEKGGGGCNLVFFENVFSPVSY